MHRIRRSFCNICSKYKSFIATYAVLILIPLVLCLALYWGTRIVIDRQIQKLGEQTVESFQAKTSAAIQEIYTLSDALCHDQGFLSLLSNQDIQQSSSGYLTICNSIDNHIMRSSYVGQVFLFCESLNSIYSANCRFNYSSASSLLDEYSTSISPDDLSNETGWHFLSSAYCFPYYIQNVYSIDGGELLGTLVVYVDTTAFLSIFTETSADLCVMFHDQFYIASTAKPLQSADWHSEKFVEEFLKDDVRCFYIDEENFSYLVAISLSEYNAPLKYVLWIFIAYFLTTLILCTVYSMRASRKKYRELMDVISEVPHDPVVDMSYSQMMVTIKRALTNSVETVSRAKALRYILHGYYERSLTDPDLSNAGIVQAPSYRLVSFHLRSYKDVISFDRDDKFAEARRVIIESALNTVSEGHYSAVVTNIDLMFCAVYSIITEAFPVEMFQQAIESALSILEEKYGLNIIAIASSALNSPDEFSLAYKKIDDIYKFYPATTPPPIFLSYWKTTFPADILIRQVMRFCADCLNL